MYLCSDTYKLRNFWTFIQEYPKLFAFKVSEKVKEILTELLNLLSAMFWAKRFINLRRVVTDAQESKVVFQDDGSPTVTVFTAYPTSKYQNISVLDLNVSFFLPVVSVLGSLTRQKKTIDPTFECKFDLCCAVLFSNFIPSKQKSLSSTSNVASLEKVMDTCVRCLR